MFNNNNGTYGYNNGAQSFFTVEEGYLVNESPAQNSPVADNSRNIKRLFSRVFMSVFFFILASYVILYAIEFASIIILGYDRYEELLQNSNLAIFKSAVCQYIFGFGVLLLFIRKIPKCSRASSKSSLSLKDLACYFFICQFLAYLGSFIGNGLNQLIGAVTGDMPTNTLDELLNGAKLWVVIVVAIVIGPIFEELIFRKLMIDRLGAVGERCAVIFTSVAFGIFHQNFYQFFYALFIGLVLGFIYSKTHNIFYSIGIHISFNFFGSALPLLLNDTFTEYDKMSEVILAGGEVDMTLYAQASLIVMIYSAFVLGSALLGLIFLIQKYKRGELRLSSEAELYAPKRVLLRSSILNLGTVLFFATSIILTILTLFLG